MASLVTPVLLGTVIGSMSSGEIRAEGAIAVGASLAWLSPFPISVGLLTLAVFSHLAAVYLIFESDDPALKDDFRARALWSSAVVAFLMLAVPLLAYRCARDFYDDLLWSEWSTGLVFMTATAALGAHVSLQLRSYAVARICAAAQAALLLVGWGAAQYPFLVRPDLTITAAASSQESLRLILIALAAGGALLFPAILFLFWMFKKEAILGGWRRP